MRRPFACLLAACALPLFAAFELFDKPPVQGILRDGAALAAGCGQDGSGALRITGNGKTAQYAYSYRWNQVEPGKQYGISFACRPSPGFKGAVLVAVNFARGGWKFEPKASLSRTVPLPQDRWGHQQVVFTVPEGFNQCEATIRLVKVPADCHLLVDNLRVANVTSDKNFFRARHLDTIFDNWTFLGQQHFEHYCLGPGAKVVMDWKQAKAGESFLEIRGDGTRMQYPLVIQNLAVEPDRNYRFSVWYNASRHFDAGIRLFMFECMDENRRHLAQPRVGVRATKGEWRELVFDFKTPANARLLDIMFNLRHFPQDAVIRFDQLKFEEGAVGPDLRQSFQPEKQTMTVACPVLGDLGAVKPVENSYEVRTMDGRPFRALKSPANEPLTVSVADFPDGEYMLHASVRLSDGSTMACEPRHFGIYKQPYWKNDLGILKDADPAPAPWRGLTRDGAAVTAWNGVFRFGPALELEQFTENGGTPLLKQPLAVACDGKPLAATGPVAWQPGRARLAASVPVTASGWTGTLRMVIDYMGFVRYALDLDSTPKATDLSDVRVSFAVHGAEFVHRSDASWSDIGAIDLKAQPRWETRHRYHEIMVGNVDRGLAWYAPRCFPCANDFNTAAAAADASGAFTARLVHAALAMTSNRPCRIEFAVMPWPFRPAADHWKRLRFRAYQYSNFNMMSSMKPMKYCGLPASRDDALTMTHAQKLQGPGEVGTLYQIPFYITDTMPEFRYFEEQWQGYPSRYYVLKAFGKNAKMRKCDTRARLWQDLYCFMADKYLRQFPWRGFYYDCYGSDLYSAHGISFHPTFETRQFHERVYLTTNAVHPGFLTFTHQGGQQACTSAGFTDVTLMGEQYRAPCMTHDYYLQFLTLDQFRYENAVRIGPDRMFLPQYRQPDKIASPEIAAHAAGLAFLHNCMLYPSFIQADVCKRMICWLYGFGVKDAAFFPYWKPSPDGVSTSDPAVPVSYWKSPKGILATVLNSTSQAKTVRVTLPGNAAATLLAPVTGAETPFASGQDLTLPPYQAVLIRATAD